MDASKFYIRVRRKCNQQLKTASITIDKQTGYVFVNYGGWDRRLPVVLSPMRLNLLDKRTDDIVQQTVDLIVKESRKMEKQIDNI